MVHLEPGAEEWGEQRFATTPGLLVLYLLVSAARDDGETCEVRVEREIGEAALLELKDGYEANVAPVGGFYMERDGVFHLDRSAITALSPCAIIKDDDVFRLHARSFDNRSLKSNAAFNRLLFKQLSIGVQYLRNEVAACKCLSFACSMANSYLCVEHEQTCLRWC